MTERGLPTAPSALPTPKEKQRLISSVQALLGTALFFFARPYGRVAAGRGVQRKRGKNRCPRLSIINGYRKRHVESKTNVAFPPKGKAYIVQPHLICNQTNPPTTQKRASAHRFAQVAVRLVFALINYFSTSKSSEEKISSSKNSVRDILNPLASKITVLRVTVLFRPFMMHCMLPC